MLIFIFNVQFYFIFFAGVREIKSEKPRIIFINENNRVIAGEMILISCISTGNPVPDITWYINRMPIFRVVQLTNELSINQYHKRYLSVNFKRQKITKSTLIFKRALMEDNNSFLTCESENVMGIDTQTTKLNVFEKKHATLFPSVILEGNTKLILKLKNSQAQLKCVYSNFPNAKVYWFKTFELISEPEYKISEGKSISSLGIRYVMPENEGSYKCLVVNDVGGQLSQTLIIKVSSIPSITNNVSITDISASSATVCWSSFVNLSVVEEFIINYESKLENNSISIKVDKTNKNSIGYDCHTLKSLQPFTSYKTWVVSSNSLGKSEIGKIAYFNTLEDLPEQPPTCITASAISNTAVEVRWKPVRKINGILQKYILLYTEHPDLPNQHWRHFDSKTDSSLISHLTPNKVHHITIQAVNSIGKGPFSRPVAILTKSGTISECPEFRATLILINFIKIEWEEPDPSKLLNCAGLELEIKYNIPSLLLERKVVNINAFQYSYEVVNVKEDVEMIFILRAYNQVGFGMPVKLSIMSAGKAKINKNVIEVLDRTSFTIVSRWRRPDKDATNITLQLLEVFDKSFQTIRSVKLHNYKINFKIDEWNIFNFTRLKSYQKYQIRLTFLKRELSNTIRESFYESNTVETLKSTVPHTIGYFNLNSGKDNKNMTAIFAEWEDVPNFENSSAETIYQIKYRIVSPEELSTAFKSLIINSTSWTLSLEDQPKYGVSYEVILSRFGNNNAKLNAKKIVKMPEERPSRPPTNFRITNMTKSSVTIVYDHPLAKYRNGKIILFEVNLKTIKYNEKSQIINTTKNIVIFNNLQMGTYKARIRAYTNIGHGPWSDYMNFNVQDVDIEPPRSIKAFRITDSRIKVEWDMGYDQYFTPYIFSKNIIGYVLYYGTRDTFNVTTDWKQIKLYENVYSYEIKNVHESNFYIVRMSSIDKYSRVGKWSSPAFPEKMDLSIYNIKTLTNMHCFNITSNAIEIRGRYPIDTKYLNSISIFFSGISIFWSSINNERVEIIPERNILFEYPLKEQVFKFILQDLYPNTKYKIRITPIYSKNTKLGSNITLSTTVQCETKFAAPRHLEFPQIINSTEFSTTFRLKRAEERNGKIDYYHLLIIPYRSKNNIVFLEYNKPPNDFRLIELTENINEKHKVQPFVAFHKKTNELFNNQPLYDFVFDYRSVKQFRQKSLINGIFYRTSLRGCIQADEDQSLCNSSQWSKQFQINLNFPSNIKNQISKITEIYSKNPKFNEQTVITLSITLSGILVAVICIIIGCVVRKRKASNKKWDNPSRLSAPELLQDAQMTPLVPVNSPKIDQERCHLRNDQNYGFDTNNEILNYEGYGNHTVSKNHFDSPIQMKSKLQINHKEIAPDLVNLCEGFNFFNKDLPQISSNTSRYVIPVIKLASYVEDLKSYDSLNLMHEFEDLNKEMMEKYPSLTSNLPHNKMKNRYANVVAYDHSLVKLQNPTDGENNDYINANFIDGYGKQNEYIATQSPFQETINDFWQMIWEQNVIIIVMLVKAEETDSKKCEIYWPKKGTRNYFNFEVTLILSIIRAHYIISKLQIKQKGFPMKRQIVHLQFTGWPDQGIPILTVPFISFVKVYRSFSKISSGPTAVHCSAGVGRTGVFIAVNSQIDRMKNEKSVNIYDQIKTIRKQRNYMVQTEAQYGFIYDVLLEWSQESISEINPELFVNYIKTKSHIVEDYKLNGFEMEFQMLNLQSTKVNANMSRIHGNAAVNKQKNNFAHLLPFDWNRVTLSSISGVEGSDYINASYIDSYSKTKAYIVSQNPMASTVEDFWRLVWDKNCTIIIVLGKLDEFVKELSLPYWPVQKSIRYQFFVVDPMVEYNMSNYIMREFKVTDARDGEFKTIRQFHYSKWLSNICPFDAHSFLEFIHQVQLTKENFSHGNPLLVHCSYGTGKSGIFIGINNIIEKLKHENVVDVFNTVKLLQLQRVGLVQTVDQYKFCYLTVLTHLIDLSPDLKNQFCGFKEYINISNNN